MSDYISRQALLTQISAFQYSDFLDEETEREYLIVDKIIDMISTLPTADVQEVKHAKWIDSPNIMECVVCLNCMSGNLSAQVVAPAPDWYNYCPVCGAKMDAERENNE